MLGRIRSPRVGANSRAIQPPVIFGAVFVRTDSLVRKGNSTLAQTSSSPCGRRPRPGRRSASHGWQTVAHPTGRATSASHSPPRGERGRTARSWQTESRREKPPGPRWRLSRSRVYREIALDETQHTQLSWDMAEWLWPRLSQAARTRVREAGARAVADLVAAVHRPISRELARVAGLSAVDVARVLVTRLARSLRVSKHAGWG